MTAAGSKNAVFLPLLQYNEVNRRFRENKSSSHGHTRIRGRSFTSSLTACGKRYVLKIMKDSL